MHPEEEETGLLHPGQVGYIGIVLSHNSPYGIFLTTKSLTSLQHEGIFRGLTRLMNP
jgi:hypothetical protein